MNDHWKVLYQVSVFYVDRKSKMATRRSLKCEKLTDETTDCQVITIVLMDLWSSLTKKGSHYLPDLTQLNVQWISHKDLCSNNGIKLCGPLQSVCFSFQSDTQHGYATTSNIICSDWLKFQRSSSLKLIIMKWLNPNCKWMIITVIW
jgi:hypothetical protein